MAMISPPLPLLPSPFAPRRVRRRVPRLRYPTSIAVSYKRALEAYIKRLGEIVEGAWQGRLSTLIDEAARERGDSALKYPKIGTFAGDAVTDELWSELSRIRREFSGVLTEAQMEEIARRFSDRAVAYTTERFAFQVKAVTGLDPLLRDRKLQNLVKASVAENVRLIRSIPEQYHAEIQRVIYSGVREGKTAGDLTKEIRRVYGVTRNRAKLIATDQIGSLVGAVTKERHQQLGLKRFVWRTALDSRVRPSHAAREGRIYTWETGAGGEFPGGPINCRCTAEPLPEELAEFAGMAPPAPVEERPAPPSKPSLPKFYPNALPKDFERRVEERLKAAGLTDLSDEELEKFIDELARTRYVEKEMSERVKALMDLNREVAEEMNKTALPGGALPGDVWREWSEAWAESAQGDIQGAWKYWAEERFGEDVTTEFSSLGYIDRRKAARERFLALAKKYMRETKEYLGGLGPQRIFEAQYRYTQVVLRAIFGKRRTVKLYRGITNEFFTNVGSKPWEMGHTGKVALNSLNSFTFDESIAEGFVHYGGVVIEVEVPIEDVAASVFDGLLMENIHEVEAVVVGKPLKFKVIEVMEEAR